MEYKITPETKVFDLVQSGLIHALDAEVLRKFVIIHTNTGKAPNNFIVKDLLPFSVGDFTNRDSAYHVKFRDIDALCHAIEENGMHIKWYHQVEIIDENTTFDDLRNYDLISVRLFNCILRARRFCKIEKHGRYVPHTLGELVETWNYGQLLQIRYMGVQTAEELCQLLYQNGMLVRGYEPDKPETGSTLTMLDMDDGDIFVVDGERYIKIAGSLDGVNMATGVFTHFTSSTTVDRKLQNRFKKEKK